MFYLYKKVFKIICVIILVIIFIIIDFPNMPAPSITNEFINDRFGFNITEESTVLYEVNSYGGFPPEGDIYKVFELSNYDYDKLTSSVFLDNTEVSGDEFLYDYMHICGYFFDDYLDDSLNYNVPEEYQLNLDMDDYYWLYLKDNYNVEFYGIIDKESKLLFACFFLDNLYKI